MEERCLRCHGAGWLPPKDNKRILTQRVPFVRCICDDGRVKKDEKANVETKSAT